MSIPRQPFFERMIPHGIPSYLSKIAVATLVGIAFLGIHPMALRQIGVDGGERSWILAVILAVATLSVYVASGTLWNLFEEMTFRLDGDTTFLARVDRMLRDRWFLTAAVSFGTVNCLFGQAFGPPLSSQDLARVTLFVGYWLAGFVCGIAIWGIYGVLVAVSDFAEAVEAARDGALGLDYRSPDRCGGMLFVGNAVLVFGSVTLVTGVVISTYIVAEAWTHAVGWARWLQFFWIVWPYLATAVVVAGPFAELHGVLRRYKREQDKILQQRLETALKALAEAGLGNEQRKGRRAEAEQITESREQLFGMRTWPAGWPAGAKGAIVLIPNTVVSAYQWIKTVSSDL